MLALITPNVSLQSRRPILSRHPAQSVARWCSQDTAEAAERCGGAIAASKVVDSLKLGDDGNMILRSVPREAVWRAETPQVFNVEKFKKAYAALGDELCTDDAEVMKLAGCQVALVETGFPNFKLTAPADMELLKICVKIGGADVQ